MCPKEEGGGGRYNRKREASITVSINKDIHTHTHTTTTTTREYIVISSSFFCVSNMEDGALSSMYTHADNKQLRGMNVLVYTHVTHQEEEEEAE